MLLGMYSRRVALSAFSKVSIKVVIIPCDGGKKSGGRKRARIVKKVVREGEGYIEMGEIEQTVYVCLQKRIVHGLKRHQSYSWCCM